MTSARQILANQNNARRSTGPRSQAGKNRVRRNALRHGLTASSTIDDRDAIENHARDIAADDASPVRLELARAIAQANMDLARVRQVKLSVLERIARFGTLTRQPHLFASDEPIVLTTSEVKRVWSALERGKSSRLRRTRTLPDMPEADPELATEVIRRALPELLKIERYELDALARKQRSVTMLARLGPASRCLQTPREP
jgi:hypothetical protein